MIQNFIKIAWRNLKKNRTYSIINIAGLGIGLSCFLLISLYIYDELHFDRYPEHADRIYRINSDIRFGGADLHMAHTSDMMGELLQKDHPGVEEYTRIYTSSGSKLIKKGNEYINESRVAHVDSTFFDLFTLPAIAGDPKTALREPNTVVLTQSAARKYFGTTDVVGKTIETDDNTRTIYNITAVVADIPENAHFHFDFLFSMRNVRYNWGQITSHNFYTYLLLRKGANYKKLEQQFTKYIDDYVLPSARQYMNINSMADFERAGNKLVYSLMPLTDIHLHSDYSGELSPAGNIQYIYIFSAVALFILILACINFMNLTTARSANRAREVGIRKVLGTERRQLISQFLFESVAMVAISLALALGVCYVVLPAFNSLAGREISLSPLFSLPLLALLVALPLVVGFLAGIYPAFYLSAFRPIAVLKGKLLPGSGKFGLRSALVVFQFATSIVLIIATILVYSQLQYIQNRNPGFNRDQVLVVDGAYSLGNNAHAFRDEISKLPGVTSASLSAFLPVSNSSRTDYTFSREQQMTPENGIDMQVWQIDDAYLNTLGMEMAAGRNFSRDFGSDSSAIIINETTAKSLGYKDPVGKFIYTSGGDPGSVITYKIIGVVKNFNFESFRQGIGPLAFLLKDNPGLAIFKVKSQDLSGLISAVEHQWKQMAPGIPFSYRFLDESFNEMYHNEQRVGKLAILFSALAIIIACLGLFGLSTFIAEQRTKEIGIRKVLGAGTPGLVRLLSKDFVLLVLVAFVIASPLAWWAMNRWLEDFAFRVPVYWWVFPVAGATALLIALGTVSFQAVRAALSNPVRSLRTE